MGNYQLNPLLFHIAEDYQKEGVSKTDSILNAMVDFDKLSDRLKTPRKGRKVTCPKCGDVLIFDKQLTNEVKSK